MSNFKIIETRTSKIIKFNNNVYKFKAVTNTREKNNLWSCSLENCRAFIKLNNDNTRLLETNEKHEHAISHRKTSEDGTSSNGGTPTIGTPNRERTFTSSPASLSDSSPKGSTQGSPKNLGQPKDVKSTSKTDPETNIPTPVDTRSLDFRNLLPTDQSILSVGTPALDVTSGDSTFNGTPQARDNSKELKFQIQCLAQEIINKQVEIDRLKNKSLEDDQIIREMIQTIRILEDSQNPVTSKQKGEVNQSRNPKQQSRKPDNTSAVVASGEGNTNMMLSNQQKKTLIGLYGDSHVRDLRTHLGKELPHTYDIHAHFKPGGTFQEVANNMSEADLKYDKICVIAGTNDVCHSTWTEVENAVVQISSIFKNREIFFVLTPPRGEKTIMNKYVKIFNKNIKTLAKSLGNITCIEIGYLLRFHDFLHDKLHLNRNGKVKLCKKIKEYVHLNKRTYSMSRSTRVYQNNSKTFRSKQMNTNKGNYAQSKTSNYINTDLKLNKPTTTNNNNRSNSRQFHPKARSKESSHPYSTQKTYEYFPNNNQHMHSAYKKNSASNNHYNKQRCPPFNYRQRVPSLYDFPYNHDTLMAPHPHSFPYSPYNIPISNRYTPLQERQNFHWQMTTSI